MFYVYILKQHAKNHYYVGYTNNLARRIKEHNNNLTQSTRSRKWSLICFIAFLKQGSAERFEKYLKSGSGRAFSKRHLS
jgi:predicted GIY-YIG superfamily endonuclease